MEACEAGLGVAPVPLCLCEKAIAGGTIVPLGSYPDVEFGSYWLLTAPHLRPGAACFVAWLTSAPRAFGQSIMA